MNSLPKLKKYCTAANGARRLECRIAALQIYLLSCGRWFESGYTLLLLFFRGGITVFCVFVLWKDG